MTLLMLEELEKMNGAQDTPDSEEPHGGEGGARGVEEDGKRKIFKRSVVEGVRGLIQHQQSYYNKVLEEVLNLQ